MRKLTATLIAAGAALAFAAPASAQYYPAPAPLPAYGNSYGNQHGGFANSRQLQMRIDGLRHQIRQLDRVGAISDRKADRMKREARSLDHRLRMASSYGLQPREAADIDYRIGRLEQQVRYAARGRFGRGYERDAGYYGAPASAYHGHYGRDDDHHGRRGRDHDDDDD